MTTLRNSSSLQVPLPWQTIQWQKSVDSFGVGSMPHAQIFCGVSGLGKREYAAALTNYIFCSSRKNSLGCGECRNCRLILAEVHPDFLRIRPEKLGTAIKVDEIRVLNDFVNRTAESGIAKVVLIEDADRMNRNAANALLKSLEEPPADTFFMLVSSREMKLPVTVRSRCQRINFSVPEREITVEWLRQQNRNSESCELPILLASGAPLAAQKLMSDEYKHKYTQLFLSLDLLASGRSSPTVEARSLSDLELADLLSWVSSWVGNVVRVQSISSLEQAETGCNGLDKQVDGMPVTALISFNDLVQQAFKDAVAVSNINKQLILENLLMSWQRIARSKGR